ncbi:mucin-13 [Nycticebus coucang]|uniref:mucin-13 n=1 Tax=Nycticebus coucang TaxID=9470 RepID=UPI00234DE425|nr:mucin-13 [Nycticebus coucang]
MEAFTHLTLLALLFVNLAASQNSTNVSSTIETVTNTNAAVENSSPAASITMMSTYSSATGAPSAPSASGTANPSLTLPPRPAESESTTNANPLVTVDMTTAVSPNDMSGGTLPSLTTQGNSEMFPTTKSDSSVIISTKPLPQVTSNNASSENSTSNPGTTGPRRPCQHNPCTVGSACVELHDTHVCLCLEGYYYHSSACVKGKIFPGEIKVKLSETSGLEDKTSIAYQDLYAELINLFRNIFGALYGQTIILNVSTSPSQSARSEMRAGDKAVTVRIVNILSQNANETEESVSTMIQNAINGSSNFSNYVLQNRCDYYGCNPADDACDNGLACECKSNWERPNPQAAACVASSPKCPADCSGEHRQCLIKEGGAPTCACEPGYQENHGKCQKCPFGYSGLDCEDQFQLILTILGIIAAIVILSMVIALIVTVRSRNKEKNIEEQNLIEEDFQNLRLQQTGFSNPGADRSIFPKVKIAASKDTQTQNPYVHQGNLPGPDY